MALTDNELSHCNGALDAVKTVFGNGVWQQTVFGYGVWLRR